MTVTARQCYYCTTMLPVQDLRPYGPGGSFVCFPCATATPERDAAACWNFLCLGDAAAAISPVPGVVVLDGENGPQPFGLNVPGS